MPTIFGEPTQPTLTLNCEVHKLHRAFTVALGSTVYPMQPVKLNATGFIVPAEAADKANVIIGHALVKNPSTYGEEITVVMKGHLHIRALGGAANVPAGPVKYLSQGVGANIGYQLYVAATDTTDTQGWAIEPGVLNGEMEVILF